MFLNNLYCCWKNAATQLDPCSFFRGEPEPDVKSDVIDLQQIHDVAYPVGKSFEDIISIKVQRNAVGNFSIHAKDYYENVATDGIRVELSEVPVADASHTVRVTFR